MRKQQQLTRKGLANKAYVSYETLVRVETDFRGMAFLFLPGIARALGSSVHLIILRAESFDEYVKFMGPSDEDELPKARARQPFSNINNIRRSL